MTEIPEKRRINPKKDGINPKKDGINPLKAAPFVASRSYKQEKTRLKKRAREKPVDNSKSGQAKSQET